LARARKGRRGTWLGVRWLGVRLDWFGVRVALGAVATAVLLLGLRGSHGSGLLARGAPPVAGPPGSVLLTPHLQIAVTYRAGPARVPATYAFPAGT